MNSIMKNYPKSIFYGRKITRVNVNMNIMMKHSVCLKVVSLVLMILISGCQTVSKSAESRLKSVLASETGCTAPCWHSLQPGLSAEKDLLDLVDSSSPRLFDDISQTELNPEGIEYAWDNKEFQIFTRARIHEDRIRLLGFQPLNNNISLGMITRSQGQPSAYGASVLGLHDYYVKVNLIYEKEGIVIEANFPIDLDRQRIIIETCEYEIDWNTIPERLYIYLVKPGTAGEMVKNRPIGDFNNPVHKPQSWKNEDPIKLTLCP